MARTEAVLGPAQCVCPKTAFGVLIRVARSPGPARSILRPRGAQASRLDPQYRVRPLGEVREPEAFAVGSRDDPVQLMLPISSPYRCRPSGTVSPRSANLNDFAAKNRSLTFGRAKSAGLCIKRCFWPDSSHVFVWREGCRYVDDTGRYESEEIPE
jgi:hypothetical protein